MSKSKKVYWVWVGQNATCGTPNNRTGRMSMFGDARVFSTKAKRDKYVENYWSKNGHKKASKENRKSLRSYHLGMDLANFDEMLNLMESHNLDDYMWGDS